MSVLTRKPKKAVPTTYVATTTAVAELDGQLVAFSEGETRIRADHPLRLAVPSLFAPDTSGLPLVEPRTSRIFVTPPDPFVRLAEPIPPERRVRARHDVVGGYSGRSPVMFAFAGDIRDSADPVVRGNPDAFEPAPEEADDAAVARMMAGEPGRARGGELAAAPRPGHPPRRPYM